MSGIDQVQRAVGRRDVVAGGVAPVSEHRREVSAVDNLVGGDVGAVGVAFRWGGHDRPSITV